MPPFRPQRGVGARLEITKATERWGFGRPPADGHRAAKLIPIPQHAPPIPPIPDTFGVSFTQFGTTRTAYSIMEMMLAG